ncbi:hypothetical protein BDV93DRAFT_562653 [Ceratobasidium sp. AG-I]|nr:hypothetical protein BDV93DRAFT_562653 [Ceratobasidium sp. AG-I]
MPRVTPPLWQLSAASAARSTRAPRPRRTVLPVRLHDAVLRRYTHNTIHSVNSAFELRAPSASNGLLREHAQRLFAK